MRVVIDVLEFLLRREIARIRAERNPNISEMSVANHLLGRLEYTKDNTRA